MRDNRYSSEEYRDWIIKILHENDAEELIAMIVPYGEEKSLKTMLEIYRHHRDDR